MRPPGEEIAAWFKDVPLHSGMLHEHYISGVTLIQATEKTDEVTGFDEMGAPVIGERKDLVCIPYPKVDTRVAYFWKLMELHEDWVGEIVPVTAVGGEAIGMPPGFFRYSAAKPDGKVVNFICCSMQVRVWERSRTDSDRRLIMGPPPATKAVAATTRWDADANAVMKAETGAVGRALGLAGMLIVPGSGVATYEDMQEALYGPPPGSAEAELPQPGVVPADLVADDAALRARANHLIDELREADEGGLDRFQEWARERNLTLANAQGTVLRGVIRKLEAMLGAARAA